MRVEPQKEHQWLQQLVGDWTYEGDMGEHKSTGTQSTRALGEVWVLAEGQGEITGGALGTTQMMLGFDPEKGRFVGTWIGSMMTNLWVYDGWLDESGKTLILEAEGPSMAGDGKTATYRDIIEVVSPDHHILTGNVQGEDGSWTQFMTTHYRRKG